MLLTKSDVIQVFVYCDKYSCTFISITTSAKLVEDIENNLKTFKIKSPYYNPDIECKYVSFTLGILNCIFMSMLMRTNI